MAKSFLAATANFEDFINNPSGEVNGHVLKNNESALKKAFSFFKNDTKILIFSGFAGVGKKQVTEHLLSYMSTNTVTFRMFCTESTKLDDLQLFLYKHLKQKTSVKDSAELDAIESYQEKIEYMFSKVNINFLIVLYNYDALKDDNRPDILNYIYNLSSKDFTKSIIVSRVFDTDIIPEEITHTKLIIKALSKEIFETYIREFGIKVTPAMIDQLYRLSRGYFLSACLSCKIMINQDYSANDFIVEYTNSGQKFDDFLAQKYYKLIVGTTKSAFNLFLKLHHGLNLKVLQTIGSYPEVILKTLSENFYIYKKGELYYPNEFLKLMLENVAGEEVSKKRLASYYEKQAGLAPEERDFTISRASLQEEIAFYKDIPVEPKEEKKAEEQIQEKQDENKEKPEENLDYRTLPIKDLYNKSIEFIEKYEYPKAIDALSIILDQKDKVQGSNLLYDTYTQLAKTYSYMKKWKYSLYYYELLEKHYEAISDKENLHLIQFEQGKIYYQCLRIIDAIKQFKTLCAVSKDNTIIAGCNLLLGNIALSASNTELALEYFKEGVSHIDDKTDNKTKMELYFKYAILSDEANDINNAIDFYQKCISIDDETSKYKALAYSNLADLFYDNDLFEEAKECFKKAYESDKFNKNEYGMYYSLSKVIELSETKDKESVLKMTKELKEHAKQSGDYNAIISSTIKLGDTYYDIPEPELALKEYMEVYKIEDLEEHNIKVLKSRLNDIRARLGKERFEELVPNYE